MNEEVEKLLRELFEQSDHEHSEQLAHMERSHKQQLTSMRKNQKAENRHHIQKRNSMIITNSHPLPSQLASFEPPAAPVAAVSTASATNKSAPSSPSSQLTPQSTGRRNSAIAMPTTGSIHPAA